MPGVSGLPSPPVNILMLASFPGCSSRGLISSLLSLKASLSSYVVPRSSRVWALITRAYGAETASLS